MNRSGWKCRVCTDESLSSWIEEEKLTDGAGGTNADAYGFIAVWVDMGKDISLTGIRTYSDYGSWYAPTAVTVETSLDNREWSLVGAGETRVPKDYYMYASFYDPIKTRYFRLKIRGSMLYISEVYASSE